MVAVHRRALVDGLLMARVLEQPADIGVHGAMVALQGQHISHRPSRQSAGRCRADN